jgi:hypothetical protein
MVLTPEQMRHEEEHGQLIAVAHALTAVERTMFLGKVARSYPRLNGAGVADVLELTADHDMFLDRTEPFFTKFDAQMPGDVHYAPLYAAHYIILMDLELTPGRVWSVMQRAGVVDAPRFPEVEAGLWAHDGDQGRITDGNHLLVKARAEQGMRAQGIGEDVITEFREGVRATGIPGYGQNMADIARYVTLVDRYTEMPRRVYDPTDDLALVLAEANGVGGVNGPLNSLQAMKNLRSHLDMRAAGTIKSSLLPFYGRTPE